jgi:hypothetical protein
VRASRIASAAACLLAAGLLTVGCGGGSDSSGSTAQAQEKVPSSPAPEKSAFPATEGRSLSDVIKGAEAHAEMLLMPSAQVFYEGENRYPFLLTRKEGGYVTDAEVAIYMAKVPGAKSEKQSKRGNKGQVAMAEAQALEESAVGPFPAKIESLATKPEFEGRTTSEDPEAARMVYSSQLEFPSAGEWRLAAVIKEEGETTATLLPSAEVGEFTRIPRPGDPAPKIHTPTAKDVGGDLSKITTRIPPDSQNEVDYAEALGKEPILLLFATPKFCQSRVCGPVVDVTEQAKQETGDKAAFIHMEIYNDNDPGKGVRPQVRAFHLPSVPWLFAVNRNGVVSSAIEGPFGNELLNGVVDKVVSE